MKNSDIKRMMKLTKGSTLPIIDQTALIQNGWATSDNLEIRLSVQTDIKGEGVIDLTSLNKVGSYDSAEIRDGFLHVKKGNSASKFALIGNIDEFPLAIPCKDYIDTISEEEAAQVASLVPFTGNDDLRPAMSGVFLGGKQIAATDAHMLRWFKDKQTTVSNVIIPKAAAANIAAGVVSFDNSQYPRLEIISEKQIINFRLIEGRYPEYWNVIPIDNPASLIVKTSDFVSAVKNALKSANKVTQNVLMIAHPDRLVIESEDLDLNTEYRTELPCVLFGAKYFPIAFNGSYMIKGIDTSSESTTIEMSASNRAMIINGNTLLMPLMIDDAAIGEPVFGSKIGKGSNVQAESLLEKWLAMYRKSERDWSNEIIMNCSGDGNKSSRHSVLSHLHGLDVLKSKCGVTILASEVKARFDEIIAAETPAETPAETTIQPENENGEISPEAEAPAEVVENPIQPERKIGEIIIARMPKPEPEAEEIPEAIVDETEPEPEQEDLPELLTVIESVTEKAFGVVGLTDLLPDEFLLKYGSKCKILVGTERRDGYLFSKKRRAQLDEAMQTVGLSYHAI
jgi:hypothetical protein